MTTLLLFTVGCRPELALDGKPTEASPTPEPSDPTPPGPDPTGTTPAPTFTGTRFYVSPGGDGTDGRSWATAWPELDQIGWDALAPGDRVEIGAGTYTTRLVPTRGGTPDGRISLVRSAEPGHDGPVTFDFSGTSVPDYWASYVRIEHPYLTIDGRDAAGFEWIADASCLVALDSGDDAGALELRNVKFTGFANPDNGGAALCIYSGSATLSRVWFGTQIGAEDHIKLLTGTQTTLRIEDSVFTPWISVGGSHSDLIEQCWGGCEAGDLVFRRNLVWDSGPGGQNLVFTLDPHWANVDVSYNVFADTAYAFQFTSRGALRISNNVFYNVASTFGGDGAWEAVNNVFVAPPDNTGIVWGSTPRYSLWDPDTYGYFDGDGTNLQADPQFLDPTDVLGPDGAPFTDDDGFNLRPGSPAIDRGTPTVDGVDIRGRPVAGPPDIGAYEAG